MYHRRHLFGIVLIIFLYVDASCKIPDIIVSSKPVSCYGQSDGSIIVNLNNSSTNKFEILLIDSLSKQIAVIDQTVQFPYQYSELPAGSYKIQFSSNGKVSDYPALIEGPKQLKANKINIEEIKGNQADAIATIQANPSGGTPPYAIEWSENTNNQKGIIAKNLPLGVYRCTIDDKNNCGPVSATIFLFETEIEKFISNSEN